MLKKWAWREAEKSKPDIVRSFLPFTGENAEGHSLIGSKAHLSCRKSGASPKLSDPHWPGRMWRGQSVTWHCCSPYKKKYGRSWENSLFEEKHRLHLRLWLPGWWPGLLCVWYNYWGQFILFFLNRSTINRTFPAFVCHLERLFISPLGLGDYKRQTSVQL